MITCLYINDTLIFGINVHVVNETKKSLSSDFEMKDIEEADVILGIKIRKINDGFSLCQSHYIAKILKKFDSFYVTPLGTPYDPSLYIKKKKGSSISLTEYAKIIGSAMFPMILSLILLMLLVG